MADAAITLDTAPHIAPETEVEMSDVCGRVPHDSAPVRSVLDRVSDKWSLLVMGTLGEQTLRFGELHRAIPGISHRMLTLTLRTLERDGLVSRTSYPEIPPRVEYAVTPLGSTLIPAALGLVRWAYAHVDELEANRERFDAAADAAFDV
jgi:DNA-binding HxlR family transcriptional regulator